MKTLTWMTTILYDKRRRYNPQPPLAQCSCHPPLKVTQISPNIDVWWWQSILVTFNIGDNQYWWQSILVTILVTINIGDNTGDNQYWWKSILVFEGDNVDLLLGDASSLASVHYPCHGTLSQPKTSGQVYVLFSNWLCFDSHISCIWHTLVACSISNWLHINSHNIFTNSCILILTLVEN